PARGVIAVACAHALHQQDGRLVTRISDKVNTPNAFSHPRRGRNGFKWDNHREPAMRKTPLASAALPLPEARKAPGANATCSAPEAASIDREACAATLRTCTCMAVRKASRVATRRFDLALRGTGLRSTQFLVLLSIAAEATVTLPGLTRSM